MRGSQEPVGFNMIYGGKGEVKSVVADVTTEEGRDALFAVCPIPDILAHQ